MQSRAKLCLGSASPRRLALLKQIGITPDVVIGADIDESTQKSELPRSYAQRMAYEKNTALTPRYPAHYVLTADTIVSVGRRILQKARDEGEARQMLSLIHGRSCRIITAMAVSAPEGKLIQRVSELRLKIKRLSLQELEWYLTTDEWQDKAAAFAIQGQFAKFIKTMQGSYTGAVGLDVHQVYQVLTGLGYFTS